MRAAGSSGRFPCLAGGGAFVQSLKIGSAGTFTAVIADAFAREIDHSVPLPTATVRALATKISAFDLCIWEAGQHYRGFGETVPIDSPLAPFATLPSADTPGRARQDIRRRDRLVREAWPDCPYRLSPCSQQLIYEPDDETASILAARRAYMDEHSAIGDEDDDGYDGDHYYGGRSAVSWVDRGDAAAGVMRRSCGSKTTRCGVSRRTRVSATSSRTCF